MAAKLDLSAPKPFKVLGQNTNLNSSWDTYIKRFEYYLAASGVTKEEQKKALLLHVAGEEIQDIFETLSDVGNTYKDCKDALTQYFEPKKNVSYERHNFHQANQEVGETVDNFIVRLKKLSVTCEFPDGSVNDMIRDQVVEKCRSTELRRKFLQETDLTLDKIVNLSRTSEMSDLHASKMKEASHSRPTVPDFTPHEEDVQQVRRQPTKQRKQYRPRTMPRSAPKPAKFKTCYRCGGKGHSGHECLKSRNIVCHDCKKQGHFAHMCKSKQKVQYVSNPSYVNSESGDDEFIFGLKGKSGAPFVEVKIEGRPCQLLIDSGASVNCIDKQLLHSLKRKLRLVRSFTKIYPYASKTPLKVLGTTCLNVNVKNSEHMIQFHVVDSKCTPLIGYKCAVDLGILKICNSVDSDCGSLESLLSEYKDRFEGLGKLKNYQLTLNINKDITPVAQPNRRIPFKMRQQVDKKIKELLEKDVIEKVEGPTPWISPVVVIPKANDIRLCLDLRQANRAVERERFPMPNVDETLEELNGAKYFSKLDLKMGFHQIELDPKSRQITTFVTHNGLFRYKRLLFGISCAPEIYQRIIQSTIQDIPGCRNVSDDIIVYGKTKQMHDAALRQVLHRLREKNLTLNREKCVFAQTSISFMGHKLTRDGLLPQESKIEAVQQTTVPKSVKEVKSFLGLVNYCSKFIPNFATISEPIRKLTRRGQEFTWDQEQQNAFEKLKELITSASVMVYYNPDAETTVTVDGSPYGLGAILSQKQADNQFRPVAFASRTLNEVERRYSQIERECLAVTWGVQKFGVYLYGQNFKVITDHKPLVNIFKPKHNPPARIQRMLLKLQSYTFTVEYQPGEQNAADILSRSPIQQNEDKISLQTEQFINYVCQNSVPYAMTLDQIDKESAQDSTTQELIRCIKHNKWPSSKPLNIYFKLRSELSVQNNIILRGTRIIVPESLRARVLQIAHESHQGVVKTKQMLREKVYWPGIDKDVEQMIKTCYECQLLSNPTVAPPIHTTPLPEKPWDRISMDLTGPFPTGEYLLVVIDYYSRFPEVEIMKSTTSISIIHKLMKIFSIHGLPSEITTDNAQNFVSDEMRNFFANNGIKHKRVTPYWPRANGLVENFNKTLGKFIKTAVAANKNWRVELHKFLLNYRTTPQVTTGRAPSELLFNRTVRNKLPHFQKVKQNRELKRHDQVQKDKMKRNADKHLNRRQFNYKLGQSVLILKRNRGKVDAKWENIIFSVIGQKGSQVKLKSPDGQVLFRHISHVRPFYGHVK